MTENQEAVKKLVMNEVLMMASDIVEHIRVKEVEAESHELMSEISDAISALHDVNYDLEEEIEVYEWWFVTDYLAEKLKERQEVIVEFFPGRPLWGRQTTGQAIYLDDTIMDIWKEVQKAV